ncbi:MAG: exodeoxyribonuclease III [Burkholderiaceae bacterium]
MHIATWNVNSLKVRLPQVLDWLAAHPVDVLCLQETKLRDEHFPVAALAEAGYEVAFAGQPTYNGVAILGRRATVGMPADVIVGNPHFDDPQQRLISATIGGLRVVCAYFPNGQAVGSEKFDYKLRWIDALIAWLGDSAAAAPAPIALLGDFNIAPEDRDVHDPEKWAGQIHCSDEERARFSRLVALGMVDAFRLFEQPEKQFSWWDYRMLGFRRNAGLRIDHILVDARIAGRVEACRIDREPRKLDKPSDHAPVIAELTP